MKIFVTKTVSGLVPASRNEFDKLQDAKLRIGEFYEVEIKKKRNVGFHRKFFALLTVCFDNQERFDDPEDLRAFLTMKAGYVKKIETPGGIFHRPKSISFSAMDQVDFEAYYDKAFIQVLKLLDCKLEDLTETLKDF